MRFGPPECPRCPGMHHFDEWCGISPEAIARENASMLRAIENMKPGKPAPFFTIIGRPKETSEMSYSFSVRGTTKAEVTSKISDELAKVVASQPIHAADRAQAQAAAEAFVALIPPSADNKDFYVSVSGSLGWNGNLGEGHVVTSASVNVSASLIAKETP